MNNQKIIFCLHLLDALNAYSKDYQGDKVPFEYVVDDIIACLHGELGKISNPFYENPLTPKSNEK